jgi:hypothetical protein
LQIWIVAPLQPVWALVSDVELMPTMSLGQGDRDLA